MINLYVKLSKSKIILLKKEKEKKTHFFFFLNYSVEDSEGEKYFVYNFFTSFSITWDCPLFHMWVLACKLSLPLTKYL